MSKNYFNTVVPAVFVSMLISTVYAESDPMVIVVTSSAMEQPRNQASTTLTVIDRY